MKILVVGADGYIGRALCDELKREDEKVEMWDNGFRGSFMITQGFVSGVDVGIRTEIRSVDIAHEYERVVEGLEKFRPRVIVNLGQIPMPTYSMISPMKALFTMANNVGGLLNLCWACKELEIDPLIVTLGTLGEYGYDNRLSESDGGWIEWKGEKVPTPRNPTASLYHVSKVQASYVGMFASQVWGTRIVDIMQGPVYGAREDVWWYFDWISGTVINRTIAQVISGEVLRYGSGKQKRAFISLEDSVRALMTVARKWREDGYVAINQFDPESIMTCEEVIKKCVEIGGSFGFECKVREIENPRIEKEEGVHNPRMEILEELGFKPRVTVEEEIERTFELVNVERIRSYKDTIWPKKVFGWS